MKSIVQILESRQEQIRELNSLLREMQLNNKRIVYASFYVTIAAAKETGEREEQLEKFKKQRGNPSPDIVLVLVDCATRSSLGVDVCSLLVEVSTKNMPFVNGLVKRNAVLYDRIIDLCHKLKLHIKNV